MTLSLKHLQVRDFILAEFARTGAIPSLKEIAAACGLANYVTAHRYKRRIQKAGELRFVVESPKVKAAESPKVKAAGV